MTTRHGETDYEERNYMTLNPRCGVKTHPYTKQKKKKKKISHRHCIGPLRGTSSPFSASSRRGLNPIKPVYDPDRPDGRLNLTAGAFNQLGQYTAVLIAGATATQNSPFSSLAVAVTIASTHCVYPRRIARLSWPGWLVKQ